MVQLFENFQSQVSWKNGDTALVSIRGGECYFITDSNRPSKRKFDVLEAIIKLQAVDRKSGYKWIGEIIWVGDASVPGNANQILGILIETAMKPGSGSNGGRKINRLLVEGNQMTKNDDLAKKIMTFDASVYKAHKILPLNAQVYKENGDPVSPGIKEYRSGRKPITLWASIILGRPATTCDWINKNIIFPSDIFAGDSSTTTYDSYVRMLNQMGLMVKKTGEDSYTQNLTNITKTFVFANNRTADEFKKWLNEKIKEFPKISEDISGNYVANNDSTNIKVFARDNDNWTVNILSKSLSPMSLKSLAQHHLGDEIDNTEVMGGEDAVSGLLEGFNS